MSCSSGRFCLQQHYSMGCLQWILTSLRKNPCKKRIVLNHTMLWTSKKTGPWYGYEWSGNRKKGRGGVWRWHLLDSLQLSSCAGIKETLHWESAPWLLHKRRPPWHDPIAFGWCTNTRIGGRRVKFRREVWELLHGGVSRREESGVGRIEREKGKWSLGYLLPLRHWRMPWCFPFRWLN